MDGNQQFDRHHRFESSPPTFTVEGTEEATDDSAASSSMSFLFDAFYFIVPIAGVLLNCYVFMRLRRIAKRHAYRFETSSALPLCAMSICDTFCLLAQLFQAAFHIIVGWTSASAHFSDLEYPTMIDFNVDSETDLNSDLVSPVMAPLSLFCKIDMYILHLTSAFSVWCWLMLSILRYTAVFHPLRYHTIWRQPRHALIIMAAASCVLESWILITVSYIPLTRSCNEDPLVDFKSLQVAHLTDIVLGYLLPAFIRIGLDGVVLGYCYHPHFLSPRFLERRHGISDTSQQQTVSTIADAPLLSNMTSLAKKASDRRETLGRKKNSMIVRSLIISAINLGCNLPSHVLRIAWTLNTELAGDVDGGSGVYIFIEALSQILYFGQFTCNALYLSTTIYETSMPSNKAYGSSSKGVGSRILDDT